MGALQMRSNGPLGFLKTWSKKTWIIVGSVAVVILIIIIVVPVEVAKENAYPDYTTINYTLADTFSGSDFFDNFDYFTDTDPSNGYVTYVDESTASSLNLTYATTSSAILRVDTSDSTTDDDDDSSSSGSSGSSSSSSNDNNNNNNNNNNNQNNQPGSPGKSRRTTSTTGRNSVRVTSKNQYNSGLFIFDVKHTPFGCGTWPALWLTDADNWPTNGEIDVMEAVNLADTGNQMTLHTADGCEMDHKRRETGSALYDNCYWEANSESGCGVQASNTSTFGADYNTEGGGVTAVEWRSEGIRVWQFARDGIPEDITNNSPDPSTWGTAAADFPDTGCDIDTHFKNQSIIINIDLCGDWAGSDVYTEAGCPSNCTDFVANNPSNFTNAYWEFGSFQVYQKS